MLWVSRLIDFSFCFPLPFPKLHPLHDQKDEWQQNFRAPLCKAMSRRQFLQAPLETHPNALG